MLRAAMRRLRYLPAPCLPHADKRVAGLFRRANQWHTATGGRRPGDWWPPHAARLIRPSRRCISREGCYID